MRAPVTRTTRGVTGFGQLRGTFRPADLGEKRTALRRLRESQRASGARCDSVFAFFSNRLGCFGSIIVSVIGTLLLLALMRGCSGGGGAVW
jgi:hypothetical protein